MTTDRSHMPRGRTEVSVENGKYTVVIDHRPEKEGLAVLRHGKSWISNDELIGSNMIISMACDLERCRDLLWAISKDFDPDTQSGPPCGPELLQKIKEALPLDYQPAMYP